MNDVCRVQVVDCAEEVVEDRDDVLLVELRRLLGREDFLEIKLLVVEDEEDVIEAVLKAVWERILRDNDVVQLGRKNVAWLFR